MTTQQQREALKAAYPNGKSWHKKVDRMADDQVQAIYLRMKAQGKV